MNDLPTVSVSHRVPSVSGDSASVSVPLFREGTRIHSLVGLAERVMKARCESVCSRCRTTIVTGQQIGLIARKWIHVACLIRRQQIPASEAAR